MSKGKVLIIDDTIEMARTVAEYLDRHGLEGAAVGSGAEGLKELERWRPDVVLTDLRMQGQDGLDVLDSAKALDADIPVIIMTAFGGVDSAVEAIQRGAYHYITKPFKLDVVRVLLERAIAERQLRTENAGLRRTVREALPHDTLIGRGPGIRTIIERIHRVADTTVPILVHGETGTGKELVARAIHAESSRRESPFVAINCAAVPEALLESELFGHIRGAFTGATQRRHGLFLEAHGGTLLLDEIGEMPLTLQAKLLRVIETGEIRPVGHDTPTQTDVRIIAATNRHLPALVKEGAFRQDLFFRLNVVPVELPPLRARTEDIPLLVEHFLRQSQRRFPNAMPRSFSPGALRLLIEYPWPGNVRELENLVDRWMITGDTREIGVAHVKSVLSELGEHPLDIAKREHLSLQELEQSYIAWVLNAVGGNKTRAADILKIDPSTLYRRERQAKT